MIHAGRRCRVCGCTDRKACYDEIAGHACYWVAQDLCSACEDYAAEERANEELSGLGDVPDARCPMPDARSEEAPR